MVSPSEEICTPDQIPAGAIAISPNELRQRLREIIAYGKRTGIIIPVFIFGPPGVGKTDLINDIGREINAEVHTFIASTMDPTEIRGIPYPIQDSNYESGGYAEWYPQRAWLSPKGAEHQYQIYFFDELNLATKATQAAFYRLILEGRLDTIDISRDARIAAGNEKSQVREVQEMNLALTTRFEIYYVRPDAKSWLEWAKSHDIEEPVVQYIEEHPTQIYCVNQQNPNLAKANPRGWARVSQLLRIGLMSKEDITGSVGRDPANKFLAFLANKPERKVPNFGLEKFGGVE